MVKKLKGELVKQRVRLEKSSNPSLFNSLVSKSLFGTNVGEDVFLNLFESIYLINKSNLEIFNKGKLVSPTDLMKIGLRKDKLFFEKSLVFSHLRKLGYFLRPGLKYGSDFLIYDKKTDLFSGHSKWVLKVFLNTSKISASDFSANARVSNSVRKKFLIAFVDNDLRITFFETGWIKL